jgi:hypothetical protein
MKTFTVHAPPGANTNALRDAERFVLVKDGFCWPALFVPLLWLLWHRLWLVMLGWLAAVLVLSAGAGFFDAAQPLVLVTAFLFAIWFALEANGLRRWTLKRRGWEQLGLTTGRNITDCERDFFTRWVERARPAPEPSLRSAGVPKRRASSGDDPVIGLFPKAD